MANEQNEGRFLTDIQRAYLAGDYDCPNNNAEYQLRSTIRSRIETALHEFQVVNRLVSDKDLELIFDDWEGEMSEYPNFVNSNPQNSHYQIQMPEKIPEIQSIISVAYRGYRLNGMDANEFVNKVLETGLQRAEADRKGVEKDHVSVDLELDNLEVHTDTDELEPIEKFDKGIAMTWEEQQTLYNQLEDKLDRDFSLSEAGELIEKHLLEANESPD